jgi:subtilisin family serine protease
MGVTNEILVLFLPTVTEDQRKELQQSLNSTLIKTTKIYQKFRVPKGADALAIANKFYESGLVEFATPNFISYGEYLQTIPNDTYFNKQITCHNTGQIFTDGHSGTNDADIDAPEAWALTAGSSDVIIAVLDQGVTSNHADLPNSRQIRLDGSNFGDYGDADDPSPIGDENHGNACAGVIAATMNNNQGIAGIAPNCRIMPVRLPEGFNPDIVAEAIEFAVDSGATILSNSWGYNTTNQNAHPVIITAINHALSNNRVVIFAAGNTADHVHNDDGYVTFPANVNIPGVITVGASDRYDSQANYSPTSSLIDVVAPSHRAYPSQISGETLEMWSIDIPGNTGYNPYPASMPHPPSTDEILPNSGTNYLAYTARFGGTSHSCPVVAGVVALMLSVNPNLTYMQVFNILTSIADTVGGYTYTNGRCNEMGYGRVNAYAAVIAAAGGPISGPIQVCASGSTFSISPLAPFDSIHWDKGACLNISSGQGTTSCTFVASCYGSSYVSVTVYANGHGTTLPQKTVYAALATPPLFDVSGPGSIVLNSTEHYVADILPRDLSTYGIYYYDWSVTSKLQFESSHAYRTDAYIKGISLGFGTISFYTTNGCGTSTFNFLVRVISSKSLSIYPNPASNEITIEIDDEANFEDTSSNLLISESIPDAEYLVTVYNNSGMPVFINKYLNVNEIRINTSSWQKGIYYVILTFNEENYSGALIIE